MWQFLESIENSGFATWVRETPSVLGYSTVLALHTFGMAFLVGLSGAIALRVLGIIPALPLKPLEKLFPLILIGFWVNAVTGVVLTTLAARSLLTNWDFYVKLTAIACAILGLRRLRAYAFRDPPRGEAAIVPPQARAWAVAMLTCWGIAVLAGRLTAYTNYVRQRTIIAVLLAVALILSARYVVLRASTYLARRSFPVAPTPSQARVTAPTHY